MYVISRTCRLGGASIHVWLDKSKSQKGLNVRKVVAVEWGGGPMALGGAEFFCRPIDVPRALKLVQRGHCSVHCVLGFSFRLFFGGPFFFFCSTLCIVYDVR